MYWLRLTELVLNGNTLVEVPLATKYCGVGGVTWAIAGKKAKAIKKLPSKNQALIQAGRWIAANCRFRLKFGNVTVCSCLFIS